MCGYWEEKEPTVFIRFSKELMIPKLLVALVYEDTRHNETSRLDTSVPSVKSQL